METVLNSPKPGGASRRDLALVVAGATLFLAASVTFELSEKVLAWTQPWERYQLDELPGALLFLAVALAWFSWRRMGEAREELARRIKAQQQLADALAENRRLSLSHVEVQEAERKELARELHDELGQHLNAIKINAVSIRDRTAGALPDVHGAAREIVSVADHVHGIIRDMLRRLRPVGLDELGLTAALEHVVLSWNARNPEIRARLSIATDVDSMREQQNIAIYRLVQEALNNVSRHARARKVTIDLAEAGKTGGKGGVVVTICDDGAGAPGCNAGAGGLGLIGMRERIEALSGSLAIEPGAGPGFRITATIPRGGAGHGA